MFDLSPVVDSIKYFISTNKDKDKDPSSRNYGCWIFENNADKLWFAVAHPDPRVEEDLVVELALKYFTIYDMKGTLLKNELLTKEESLCLMK